MYVSYTFCLYPLHLCKSEIFAGFEFHNYLLDLHYTTTKKHLMISLNSTLEKLNATSKDTLIEQLSIEYLEVKEGFIKAKMPVDKRTKQPFDYLHGGASIALAETIASLGSALLVDLTKNEIRGAAVTANHVGAVQRGYVYAEAKLIHKGSITHVWDIEIKDQGGYRVSVCRITVIVIPKQSQKVKASTAK